MLLRDYRLSIFVVRAVLNPDTIFSCQKSMLTSHLFSFPVAFRAPHREGAGSAITKTCSFPRQIVYLMKKIEERSTLFVWSYINILKKEDFLIYSTSAFLFRKSFSLNIFLTDPQLLSSPPPTSITLQLELYHPDVTIVLSLAKSRVQLLSNLQLLLQPPRLHQQSSHDCCSSLMEFICSFKSALYICSSFKMQHSSPSCSSDKYPLMFQGQLKHLLQLAFLLSSGTNCLFLLYIPSALGLHCYCGP